ncbi:MAG: sugar ABC transporter substrate-binding protein [Lachnospiraceae bacterium]|jgi:putative aldouronate transport system substrate-binding protein|nr:sugar ABC transporter substrate-binding protein [Lachnospiraceae bacterium]
MRFKKLFVLLSVTLLSAVVLAGCAKSNGGGNVKKFTAFFAVTQPELTSDNEIKKIIAEKIGAECEETWLTGQSDIEAINTLIALGEYPDFINGGEAMINLYQAGALIAWDEYIDKYPNIKEFFTESEWNRFRQDDGKIYWMNPFENSYGERRTTTHSAEAFWIQVRVLEWADYPKIETVEQYFDLLESYAEANPTMEDGSEVIPYSTMMQDWLYFQIENPPEFLDGYPNDGSVIVDVETQTVVDYNITPTAEYWFRSLNDAWKRGLIDDEFATQTQDEYLAKMSTGRVLGMCDQWWCFANTVNPVFKMQGLDLIGCNYVPLPITREAGMENQWSTLADVVNTASGIAITVDCEDPEGAFQMINDLLGQEVHDLRFWGVEGVDYEVDEDGMYYRTEDQIKQAGDTNYIASHMCSYSYFPMWYGTSRDGKNAMQPTEQTSVFQADMAEPLVNCLAAYDASNYIEMLNSVNKAGPWFPMYSKSSVMTVESPGGLAKKLQDDLKHQQLPIVIMAEDFDAAWDTYMDLYAETKPEDFIAEMQQILDDFMATYTE